MNSALLRYEMALLPVSYILSSVFIESIRKSIFIINEMYLSCKDFKSVVCEVISMIKSS